MTPASLSQLSPGGLTDRLQWLRKSERELLVELLWHIAEVDRRRLYLEMAFPSLFAFATDFLGYPKASAFRRTTAARLLARFPVIGEHLADGRLNPSTRRLAQDRPDDAGRAPPRTRDEQRLDEILGRAAGSTEEQVKELVAALAPRPVPVDLFRRLPAPAAPVSSGPALQPATDAPVSSGPALEPATAPIRPSRPSLEPISEELRVLRVTVGAEFARDLDAARAALSYKIPDGNLVAVLHECLRVTLAAVTKRRRGAGRTRVEDSTSPHSTGRYVAAAVRDAVWTRDESRCAFVATDGRRCDSTYQLEVHHLVPFARNGEATVDGLALRCKAHNLHEARRDFGDEHVERAIARARNGDPRQAALW